MPPLSAILLLAAAFPIAAAKPNSVSYWLMLRSDGRTWCGFRDQTEFNSEVAKMNLVPEQSAKVIYSSGKLTEVTAQVTPQSEDWVVIDVYTVAEENLVLRRTDLLTRAQLKIVQTTAIRGGHAQALHVDSVTTLRGQKAELPGDIDIPRVTVSANLSAMPFMPIVSEMRMRSITKLCKKLK